MEAPAGLGVWRPGGACIGRGRGTKRNEYHFQGADYEQENLQDAHHEYFEVELDPEALMGLGEAAKELGMTQAGVFRAIERGGLRSGQRNRRGIVGTYYRRRE